MRFTKRKVLTLEHKQAILALWNNEYPQNLHFNDIFELQDYLSKMKDQNHILLLDQNDKIKAWYTDFIRDEERWFLAILHYEFQGRKFGTKIIQMAKETNVELNGWIINSDNYKKTNGKAYKPPVEFYRKQGFQILEEVTLETDQISAIKIKWSKKPFNRGKRRF